VLLLLLLKLLQPCKLDAASSVPALQAMHSGQGQHVQPCTMSLHGAMNSSAGTSYAQVASAHEQ
jgi:hypothetical protein